MAHTADVIVEAWAPTRVGCLQEAVSGLVATFAEVRDGGGRERMPIELDPDEDSEVFVALLEDVVYVVDARGVVPVAVTLRERSDGGLTGWLDTVPVERVTEVGATPKGVSRSGLSFIQGEEGLWRCRVEVDV